jgi:hypothetical protein
MPRPPLREVPAPDLLDHFVEYDRELRRKGRAAAITRAGFARKLGKTHATVRGYLDDANLPFPPVSPGELVLLLDDAPPHELLWISVAWCELNGRQRDDLLFQPVAYLRAIGLADGPREMHRAIAHELRASASGCGLADGWTIDAHGQRLPVTFELRYGHRSNAFYVRAHLRDASDAHDAEVFNVVPGVILHRKSLDQVDLVDFERVWTDIIPPYTYPSR